MKTKNLFISILAVLFAFPLSGAFAQETSDAISIQVVTTFDYPAGNVIATIPAKINDRGDITGIYIKSSGVERGFVRFADGTFSAPIIEPNDTGGLTEGRGINNQRTVCGDYFSATDGFLHGFFLDGAGFTEFNVTDANDTLVLGLNDAGDFVGASSTVTEALRPFANLGGITTTINIPGAGALGESLAFGINRWEQITGWYDDAAGVTHGWWQDSDGTIYAPFDPPSSKQTLAFGINDHGLIVGRFFKNRRYHGFLFQPATDGFVLFDYPGAVFTSFGGINKDGLICGRYDDGSGLNHGFLAQVVTGGSDGSDSSVGSPSWSQVAPSIFRPSDRLR